MTITPSIASQMLKRNTNNRRVSKAQVIKLARDMKLGKWQLNGDSIRFAEDGSLMDGQHRLAACVQSGAPFQTIVLKNVAAESQKTIDTGKRRTIGDALDFAGYSDTRALASCSALIYEYLKAGNNLPPTTRTHASSSVIVEFVEEHPEMVSITAKARKLYKATGRSILVQIAGLLYFMLSSRNEDAADEFFDKLGSGANLPDKSPILQYRNWLIKTKAIQATTDRRYEYKTVICNGVNAWNKWRQGKQTCRITTKPTNSPFIAR